MPSPTVVNSNKDAMNTIFHPICRIAAMTVMATMLLSCNKDNGTVPEPDPVLPPEAPVISDLSGTLDEEIRSTAIRFEVTTGPADSAFVSVMAPDGDEVYSASLRTGSSESIDVEGLEPETTYIVTATAVNAPGSDAPQSASSSAEITTAAPTVQEYLTLLDVTSDSYSFRVCSSSEDGFWFTSGEYDALDWIVPGWSPDDQESLGQLLMYLYPFEGYGDMTIECVNGEQPDWAEIPIDVMPDTHYFILVADKDADGNIVGDVAFLEFNTLP